MRAYIALQCALWCLKWINFFLKTLLGFSLHSGYVKDKRRSETDYNLSVHRCNIHFRAKKTSLGSAGYKAFLLSHDRYDSPQCLLDDTVSLFELTASKALFVVTKPGMDVYSSALSPFVYQTQFTHGTQILSISLENFLRFGDELDEPKSNIVLLSNIGRCGSTLLSQMMEAVPNTITMSEPEGLSGGMPCSLKRMSKLSVEDRNKLIGVALKVQCKERRSCRVDHIVIKPRSFLISVTGIIAEQCPYVQHVFLHRDPRKNIASFIAMISSVSSWLFYKFAFPIWLHIIFSTVHESSAYYQVAQDMKETQLKGKADLLKVFAAYYSMHVRSFLDCAVDRGVNFHHLAYEDLLLNPEREMRSLLTHCKMPQDSIQGSLEAMKKDSQLNSDVSKDKLKSSRTKGFSDCEVDTINHIIKQFDLPGLDNYRDAFKYSK